MSGGHSTYSPKTGIGRWVDARMPLPRLVHDSFVSYPVPRNLNYAYTFGGILSIMLVSQILTGVVLAMHYVSRHEPGLPVRREDHARRELGLAAALSALQRRVDVLHRGLYPHLPRALLRFLQGAARAPLDPRLHHLPADDGDRLHGLRASLGTDELLGRDRHHRLLHGHPAGRRLGAAVAARRLRGRQPDAQPVLLAALPAAVHDRRRRRAACLGAACRRPDQPDRHRGEVEDRHRRLHALRDHQGCVRDGDVPDRCSPGSCSTSRTISAIRTTTSSPTR